MNGRILPATEMSGHYRLVQLLGEGGFGQVFEAWDERLCRSIAIKRLKASSAPQRSDNLIREARLAASLKHPAFVQIFSVDGDGDQQSILMELVRGSTLSQQLQTHRACQADAISIEKALDITLQIAQAMAEAHGAGLIHGDIKPSNLMLEISGEVRILDFGLACRIDPLATESLASREYAEHEGGQGTIAYLAPERMQGQHPSAASDIYALGAVLYELVAGERPFACLRGLALAAAHMQTSSTLWAFPPGTDAVVVSLVQSMTAREMTQRIASMQEVAERILAIKGGRGAVEETADFIALNTNVSLLGNEKSKKGKQLDVRRGRKRALVVLTIAALSCCGVFLWKTQGGGLVPLPVQLSSPRYSEAATLQSGLTALRQFDRPESAGIAMRDFNDVLEHQPNHATAAAGLSLVYSMLYASDARDDVWLQRADASAQLALRKNDQLALAYVAQAWVRVHQGRLDEALQLDEQALHLDPLEPFGLNVKGEVLIRMHRYDEAERCIQAAVNAYPQERLFADLLGTLRYQQADYAAAEQAFRHSIALDPNVSQAYANLNMALLKQGRNDEALRALQQGLQIRPSGRLYSNLGTALFALGDYSGAAEAFEHAVSADKGSPSHYLKWANLGDALRWIPGRSAASRDAYRQAAELLRLQLARKAGDPTDLSRMGLYAARLGDKQAAVAMSEQALAVAPVNADNHFRAAMAYELIGQRSAALDEIGQAHAYGYPLNLINTEPDLLALRRDPRYLQAMRQQKNSFKNNLKTHLIESEK